MELKRSLLCAALLLPAALGFPIQDNYENSTTTIEPTEVRKANSDLLIILGSNTVESKKVILLCFCTESPLPTETDEEDEDIFNKILKVNKDSSQFLQEGDIVPRRSRSAINCRHCNWPQSSDGIVRIPYELDPVYEESHVKGIHDAMAEFEALTCINFVKRKAERDYLSIRSADGCWSNYGKVGGGQTVSVMKGGCMWKGVIQHELEHALGFLHEHSRSDRDKHVKIMWEYISPRKYFELLNVGSGVDTSHCSQIPLLPKGVGRKHFLSTISYITADRPDFKKFENSNNLDLPYDYTSVMHYGPYTFTNTTGKATIIPIPDGSVHIGQRQGMSNLDVAKINKLYNCSRCSTILDGPSGSLRSANYPRNYTDNTNCVWLIRTRSRKVSLYFQAFQLQKTRGCQGDYVKIYDGSSKSSPVLMDKTCGSKIPSGVVASSNLMLVEFITDGAHTAFGFQATFTAGKSENKENSKENTPCQTNLLFTQENN
ncbi:Astacin-like metalloendopeptidase [Lonchura striata]|uniref:Metalloendopeptidase n=1 Tax=Lonchura striata TaxID=40157 RepID=A0A218V9T8_9PASE|nr:Astacin-like metalloendopeptidase [Lonchura striata domestica]